PRTLAWSAIAAAGAATVLSYAILADYYPKEISGRANAALNLLHVGGAFALQSLMGLIIQQWPTDGGHYPVEAHKSAMGVVLAFQCLGLGWFCLPARRRPRTQAWVDPRASSLHVHVPATRAPSLAGSAGSRHVLVWNGTAARPPRDAETLNLKGLPRRPSLPPQSGAERRAKTPAAGRPRCRTSATR
ncbi:MAG TPA: hypothetical protein VFR19_12355, partial [Hyphomicrobiaceae bacterium]|nr:hypothetical protein [Hyphomicrobiaceae bacterium]